MHLPCCAWLALALQYKTAFCDGLLWCSNCASGDDGLPYVYGGAAAGARESTDKENRPNVVVSGYALLVYSECARMSERKS